MATTRLVADVLAKWSKNGAASEENWKKGIQGLTESPTVKAAAELQRAKTNYVEAIDSGRMADRLLAVNLPSFQQSCISKSGNFRNGFSGVGLNKMQSFLTRYLPVAAQIKNTVGTMPKGTEQAAVDRMLAARRMLKAFAGKPNN